MTRHAVDGRCGGGTPQRQVRSGICCVVPMGLIRHYVPEEAGFPSSLGGAAGGTCLIVTGTFGPSPGSGCMFSREHLQGQWVFKGLGWPFQQSIAKVTYPVRNWSSRSRRSSFPVVVQGGTYLWISGGLGHFGRQSGGLARRSRATGRALFDSSFWAAEFGARMCCKNRRTTVTASRGSVGGSQSCGAKLKGGSPRP